MIGQNLKDSTITKVEVHRHSKTLFKSLESPSLRSPPLSSELLQARNEINQLEHFCFLSPSVAPRYWTEADSKKRERERNARSIHCGSGLWKFAGIISFI